MFITFSCADKYSGSHTPYKLRMDYDISLYNDTICSMMCWCFELCFKEETTNTPEWILYGICGGSLVLTILVAVIAICYFRANKHLAPAGLSLGLLYGTTNSIHTPYSKQLVFIFVCIMCHVDNLIVGKEIKFICKRKSSGMTKDNITFTFRTFLLKVINWNSQNPYSPSIGIL